MSDMGVQPAAGSAAATPGLTQWQRVAYTFTAPSKTFEDIRRGNRSWWLPLIVVGVGQLHSYGAVVQKVGMRQAMENQIRMSPKAEEGMSQASLQTKGKRPTHARRDYSRACYWPGQ